MIIAIVGPTGVGKTKMSIELAKKFNGEVINADSTQVYREVNIGTAKVTNDEKEGVVHHLIDIVDLDQDYTVYDYQIMGRDAIADIQSRSKVPTIVGGSSMYLSSLLYDYKFNKEDNVYDVDSLSDDEMYQALMAKDSTLEIDKRNRQRLIRAYVKYINNSEPIEADIGGKNLIYDDVLVIGLTTDRENLYGRINKRVDLMIEDGLIGEARELYQKYPDSKQLKTTIDYKELIQYIYGKISLDEAIVAMKQNSRNFAKRQYTWLNHKMDVKWFEVNFDNFDKTVSEVIDYMKNNKE